MTYKELVKALRAKKRLGPRMRAIETIIKSARDKTSETSLINQLDEGRAAIRVCEELTGNRRAVSPPSINVTAPDGAQLVIKHHKWAQSAKIDEVVNRVRELLINEGVIERGATHGETARNIIAGLEQILDETFNVPTFGAIFMLPEDEDISIDEGSGRTLAI